jgi:hypothetical protein
VKVSSSGRSSLLLQITPTDTGVHEAVLVPADVDALHQRQPEVSLHLQLYERCDEPFGMSTWIRVSHLDLVIKNKNESYVFLHLKFSTCLLETSWINDGSG